MDQAARDAGEERERDGLLMRSIASGDPDALAELYDRHASAMFGAALRILKSRQDAANAKAPELSPDIWVKAQREFGYAIRSLERGDLKRARRQDIEATSLYRDAELVAIKAQYLTQTRQLLEDADRARVGRYAPLTLNKAQQLLAEAERELSENRYDTDKPRTLARQANYEAKHAIYLSEVVRDVRDKNLSVEQLILAWESPLADIASAADILPRYPRCCR